LSSRAERLTLLVAAAWFALAIHGLGAADIVGDDEAREAGIVQDVVAGHWLWPRFNEELLPDKPILYHWLAAVPCAAAGFSEAMVRLPSALAGAALVAWTGLFGAELLGPYSGLVAASLVATTPAFFDHARVARPDVLLVALLSPALGFAFRWWRHGRRRDATAALALVGVATLAKGPVAPVLFGLTLGGFLLWQGELRRLPRLITPAGVAAFVVLGLGWYAVALAGWGERFVHEHLVGRYLRNLAGGLVTGDPYSPKPLTYHLLFYPLHLPIVALPWTPIVALALWRARRARGYRDPRLRFLLCWALAPVVAFTPAEWKLRHYLLPAIPALALVAAPTVLRLLREPTRRFDRRALPIVGAAALGGIALAVAVAAGWSPRLSPSDRSSVDALLSIIPGRASGLLAVAGFVAGVLAVSLAWRAWAALVGVTAVATVCWMLLGTPALEQERSRHDSLKPFARTIATLRPPPAPLAFWRDTLRPVVVYLGRPVPTLRHRDAVVPGIGLIVRESAWDALSRDGVIGFPLMIGTGRVGNVAVERVLLLEIAPGAAPLPPDPGMGRESRANYRDGHGGAPRDADAARAVRVDGPRRTTGGDHDDVDDGDHHDRDHDDRDDRATARDHDDHASRSGHDDDHGRDDHDDGTHPGRL
jgi:4-amino-4-deoxy-L-arabinose transferase-like glycosyltransferase